MPNELDEITGQINDNGRSINVINKQLPVEVGNEAKIFEIFMMVIGFVPAVFVSLSGCSVNGFIYLCLWLLGFLVYGGYYWNKIRANSYFQQLEQNIQAKASTIDNYLEQRVLVLQNTCRLVEKAIELDKDVMKSVAELRNGKPIGEDRNAVSQQIDNLYHALLPSLEAYPDLKAHNEISQAIQQNCYLQKEITAARDLYNDSVNLWNRSIYEWPVKKIVAAKARYTTRIPFITSSPVKERAQDVFF